MSPDRHTARLAATVLLAAGVVAGSAAGAGAATAPLPLPSAPAPSVTAPSLTALADPVPSVTAPSVTAPSVPAPSSVIDPVTTVTDTVTGLLGGVTKSAPAPGPIHTGPAGLTSAVSTGGRSVTTTGSPALSPPAAAPGLAPHRAAASSTQPSSPQRARTGKGSKGAGEASAAGAVRADKDPLAAVDATAPGLARACVRLTRQVVPVQTTVVVLDQDLILDLAKAGAPLDKLLVPCPAGATAAMGRDGVGSASPASVPTGAVTSGGGETGALADLLPFTGSEPGPVLFAAVVLLCAGAVLVRKARLVAAAARG